jgi:hypothetical protein
MTRIARAWGLLTLALIRRLLRETQVIRAMMFPLILTMGTLVALIGGIAFIRTPPVIAVPTGFHDDELARVLAAQHLALHEVADPREATLLGNARAGTDGHTVFTRGPTPESLLIESVLRARHPEAWQLQPLMALPDANSKPDQVLAVAWVLAGVFALNAVVLGAAIVARDRDEGTLSVEMALPLPRWVHGATRWTASTVVLAAFVAASLASVDAMFGLPAPGATLRNAIAGCAAATAIGLGTVGRAGMKTGFASALSAGLAFAFGLFALGRIVPSIAPLLPLASIPTNGEGWVPLALSLVFGAAAIAWFGRVDAA